jgi:DNA-nicking Smr family endonuclease
MDTDDEFEPDDFTDEAETDENAVVLPIEDELDLHTFAPREVPELLDAYLEACREKGFAEVRVIHGKGTGQLRARVLSLLANSPHVAYTRPAPPERGGWGATLVGLKR